MKALVFAAGLGTRLRPLTNDKPKALVTVNGVPMLERQLLNLIRYGFDDITINLYYYGEQIETFVADFLERSSFDDNTKRIKISFSPEYDLLRDTGGGILHAKELLAGEPFLVHNVDIFSNIDLKALYESAMEKFVEDSKALSMIAVSRRNTLRYLIFDNDSRLIGWENRSTGEIKSVFAEVAALSVAQIDDMGYKVFPFSGIHVISPRIFDALDEYKRRFDRECFSIIDFYLWCARDYSVYGAELDEVKICDVGKIEQLQEAERFVKSFLL